MIAYYFNARLKELDLWEARRAARRAEKREVFREVLAYAVGARRFWERVADFNNLHFDAIDAPGQAKGPADRARREDLTADLALLRAESASGAFERFCDAVEGCRLACVYELQEAGVNTAEDVTGPKSVFVGQARTAVNQEPPRYATATWS